MNKEEILGAFSLVKNPIVLDEQEIKDVQKAIEELQQKNKKLKERIGYLERSNDRREVTILEQRQEISDLEDNWNRLRKFVSKRQAISFNTEYVC